MAEARFGIHGLEDDLARQRERMAGRSPPYARALELLPDVLSGPPGRFVAAAWEHRQFFAWYDRPLLLLGALRNDALAEGPSSPLWAGFAAADPSADEVTAERLAEALDGSRERVFDALAHRGVQTNETSRAVAWLWPAALAGASRSRRPIALADVGASAGLNLVADDLPGVWTDESGAPLQIATHVRAVTRLGLDAAPLDALAEEDARWLRACVWPGERDREDRLLAAIAAFRAARIRPDAPILLPISATNVPGRLDLLSAVEPGKLVIAYQTIVRDYLEPADREEYQEGMRAWLATHPPGEALWVELETLPDGSDPPASIVAHVRTGQGELRSIELGRCGYHPRRIPRTPGGEAELRALLAHEARASARV